MTKNNWRIEFEMALSKGNKDCYVCVKKGSHCGDDDCSKDITKQFITDLLDEIAGEVERYKRDFNGELDLTPQYTNGLNNGLDQALSIIRRYKK